MTIIELANGCKVTEYRPLAESYVDWLVRMTEDNLDSGWSDLTEMYCSLSGAVIGQRDESEIVFAVRAMAETMVSSEYSNILSDITESDRHDMALDIWEALRVKFLATSRPSFAISSPNGVFGIASLPMTRQVTVLLSNLLWDTAMLRGDAFEYDKHVQRMSDVISLFAIVIEWQEQEADSFTELHAALVELDAKYRIPGMELTSHERKQIDKLSLDSIDPGKLKNIVVNMIMYRDKNWEVDLETKRWSQKVYRSSIFNAASRPEFSNLLDLKANRPSNAHIKPKAAPRTRKPAAPRTEKQQLKDRLKEKLRNGMFNLKNTKVES